MQCALVQIVEVFSHWEELTVPLKYSIWDTERVVPARASSTMPFLMASNDADSCECPDANEPSMFFVAHVFGLCCSRPSRVERAAYLVTVLQMPKTIARLPLDTAMNETTQTAVTMLGCVANAQHCALLTLWPCHCLNVQPKTA